MSLFRNFVWLTSYSSALNRVLGAAFMFGFSLFGTMLILGVLLNGLEYLIDQDSLGLGWRDLLAYATVAITTVGVAVLSYTAYMTNGIITKFREMHVYAKDNDVDLVIRAVDNGYRQRETDTHGKSMTTTLATRDGRAWDDGIPSSATG